MLHNYLALLKRVQVLLFPSPHNNTVQELGRKWLPRYFQPTEVGMPPGWTLQDSPLRDIGTPLNYPHGSVARVFTELSPDIPAEVRDSLVLSSCYIVPLLVLSDEGWERLSPHALWLLRFPRLPNELDILKALRLAMTAAAQWFLYAREAFHTITDYLHGDLPVDGLDILAEKRRIMMTQDADRLFASFPKSDRGYPFVFVADPFRLIIHWLRTMKRTLVAQLPWDDFAGTGLGFTVGVVTTPDSLRRFLRQEQSERERRETYRHPHRSRHQ